VHRAEHLRLPAGLVWSDMWSLCMHKYLPQRRHLHRPQHLLVPLWLDRADVRCLYLCKLLPERRLMHGPQSVLVYWRLVGRHMHDSTRSILLWRLRKRSLRVYKCVLLPTVLVRSQLQHLLASPVVPLWLCPRKLCGQQPMLL
jgi:hypothetical protein